MEYGDLSSHDGHVVLFMRELKGLKELWTVVPLELLPFISRVVEIFDFFGRVTLSTNYHIARTIHDVVMCLCR